jgi:hypothetical protein
MPQRQRPNTVRYNQSNNPYQATLWGDTYLTPQEALVYINQMLSTLKRYREKTE